MHLHLGGRWDLSEDRKEVVMVSSSLRISLESGSQSDQMNRIFGVQGLSLSIPSKKDLVQRSFLKQVSKVQNWEEFIVRLGLRQ